MPFTACAYSYTGKERDPTSGLDNFGARYYASTMGRFMTPDEPFYSGELDNPQDLNLYSYVHNNPLTNVDPDGHDCIYSTGVGSGVFVKSGDCYSSSDPGIYVNGTVTSANYNASNNSIGFTYTNDDTGNLGTGVIAGVPPPQPMDEGVAIPGDNGMGLIVGGRVGNYALGRALGWIGGLLGRGAGEGGETTFQALWDAATSESGTGTARVATRVRSGGFAQAQKDFDALGGTSTKAGPVQIKELPNGGGRAVLRDFSSQATGNRPTIELQPSGGGAKGAQAIRYNP